MPFWTEIRPPRPPEADAVNPRRRISRLVLGSTVWWPAIAALILALSGLAVVASQGSASGPAPIIRDAAPPTTTRDGLIDLNTATLAELQTLPGIGASRAEAIVQLRTQDPFSSLADFADRGILTPTQLLPLAELATVYVPAK